MKRNNSSNIVVMTYVPFGTPWPKLCGKPTIQAP